MSSISSRPTCRACSAQLEWPSRRASATGRCASTPAVCTVVRLKPDWRTQLLAVITNPEIAYGLLLIGIWGLLFEGYNPGGGVAGSGRRHLAC